MLIVTVLCEREMDVILLTVVCAAMVGLYQGQVRGQDMAFCFSAVENGECAGSLLGAMTPRECCVENGDSRSFVRPGEEDCITCIVFGFFQDSFTGVEQESGYTVQVGYQKGAQVAAQDLEFTVVATDVTARSGSNLDYTVNTTNVVLPFRTPTPPDDVKFILNVDNFALESNETFTLRLNSSNTNLPTGEGVFFLETLIVTIIDSDIPQLFISPERIAVSEGDGEVQVCVNLGSMIDGNVVVTVGTNPKTGATNQATANSDYESAIVSVTFEPMGSTQICLNVRIIDDELSNEPDEEFSVFLLDADPSSGFGLNESCITILDDDAPEVSLTPETIDIFENASNVEVCINLVGFLARRVGVAARTVPKTGASNQATADSDYQPTLIAVSFEPSSESMQTKCDDVLIIDDTDIEPDEQFSVQLTVVVPVGNFGVNETCITIIDDDLIVPVCHENADLIMNSGGKFVCVCRPGFTGDGVTSCDDIDECLAMTDDCSEYAECVNTEGSFECVCKPGFTGDGITCDDINECFEMTDDCSENAKCVNTKGSFEFVCKPGYTGDGRSCEDIDECTADENICDDIVTCSNLRGGYRCKCTQDDGTNCITRVKKIGRPPRRGRKSSGSSGKISSHSTPRWREKLWCGEGYMLDRNGWKCLDVNECETGDYNDCSRHVKCVNLPGTFKCVCSCLYRRRQHPKIAYNMKGTKSWKNQ